MIEKIDVELFYSPDAWAIYPPLPQKFQVLGSVVGKEGGNFAQGKKWRAHLITCYDLDLAGVPKQQRQRLLQLLSIRLSEATGRNISKISWDSLTNISV